MTGARLSTSLSLHELLVGCEDPMRSCFWIFDTKAGPFHIGSRDDYENLESLLRQLWVDVPLASGTSTSLWRPGTCPALTPRVGRGDGTYHLSLNTSESEAIEITERLLTGGWTPAQLEPILAASGGQLFLGRRDGWDVFGRDRETLAAVVAAGSSLGSSPQPCELEMPRAAPDPPPPISR